ADTATDLAAFAGVWAGDRLDGGPLPVALAVESVNSGGWANVVYAWGADQEKHMRHGWLRRRGRIVDRHRQFRTPGGALIDAWIGGDGRLLMRLTQANDWRSYALLSHVEARDLATTLAIARRRASPLWEEISVPERSAVGDAAGRSLSLEA